MLLDMHALRQQIVYNGNGTIFSEKNGLVDRGDNCWNIRLVIRWTLNKYHFSGRSGRSVVREIYALS